MASTKSGNVADELHESAVAAKQKSERPGEKGISRKAHNPCVLQSPIAVAAARHEFYLSSTPLF